MKQTAMAYLAGTIASKKEKGNKMLITLKVNEQKFYLSIWDDKLKKEMEKYNDGAFIKVVTRIDNNDYEKNEEKVYSFDFVVLEVAMASCKPFAKFKLIGRMTKEVEIRHIDAIGEDFAIGTIACNDYKTTFVNFMHRDFNENIGVIGAKGNLVAANGIITISSNGFTFYVNEIVERDGRP